MTTQPTLAYLIEPRFPGGSSTGFAQEVRVTLSRFRVSVHLHSSVMFRGREASPIVLDTLEALGVPVLTGAPVIGADFVVVQNPVFLKFDQTLSTRIVARDLIVVTGENLLRPGGAESFDAGRALRLIDKASLALRKWIAPVSDWNRKVAEDWLTAHGPMPGWNLLPVDWNYIVDLPMRPPNPRPADRRGRHSRPGREKFPDEATLELLFPRHANANVILGGDMILDLAQSRPHWSVFRFGGLPLDEYFGMIDFMVYYTSPALRESFGLAMAEAVAAGKIVITDPATAAGFHGAVLGAEPSEVDSLIRSLVSDPESFCRTVAEAQSRIGYFSGQSFLDRVFPELAPHSWRMA